jgi:hypothetical protein
MVPGQTMERAVSDNEMMTWRQLSAGLLPEHS